MELTPNSKGARLSEIVASQQETIRQQEALIAILKGALAAAGIECVPVVADWMAGLTRQEAALVGVLAAKFPGAVGRADILDQLPGHDRVRERELQLVDVVIHKVRAKLGPDAILAERGVGFRLSAVLHQRLHAA